VEAYVLEHPECAERLRRLLPTLEVLGDIGRSAASASASPLPSESQPFPVLGDYRVLREIGRGGMGIVYEAEQLSLGRRVALKVLPFASVLDPKQILRFKNEAHAAAQLHHTNIVPIFSVGCERGVHYYAMQFIDGRTLEEVVRELKAAPESEKPTPARREVFDGVARLGMQAAEALYHAHELGVVHRDIKPSNLLLDAHGNIWITDFGLARVQNEAGLTVSGDLLGTLRYMSPEQALAKRGGGPPLGHLLARNDAL
jgi:hypothetical protein